MIFYGWQYDNNLVVASLNRTFCIILLCFMKIHNQDSYDQMKYMVHQNKYKRQRPKTKGIVNYCLVM